MPDTTQKLHRPSPIRTRNRLGAIAQFNQLRPAMASKDECPIEEDYGRKQRSNHANGEPPLSSGRLASRKSEDDSGLWSRCNHLQHIRFYLIDLSLDCDPGQSYKPAKASHGIEANIEEYVLQRIMGISGSLPSSQVAKVDDSGHVVISPSTAVQALEHGVCCNPPDGFVAIDGKVALTQRRASHTRRFNNDHRAFSDDTTASDSRLGRGSSDGRIAIDGRIALMQRRARHTKGFNDDRRAFPDDATGNKVGLRITAIPSQSVGVSNVAACASKSCHSSQRKIISQYHRDEIKDAQSSCRPSKVGEITNIQSETIVATEHYIQDHSSLRDVHHGVFEREIETSGDENGMRPELEIPQPRDDVPTPKHSKTTTSNGKLLRSHTLSGHYPSGVAGEIARDCVSYINSELNSEHIDRGSPREAAHTGGRFSASLRLVFKLHQECDHEMGRIGFPRGEAVRERWILVRKELEDFTRSEWNNFISVSGVDWDKVLYPLAQLKALDGGIILGKKGPRGRRTKHKQLYLASFSSGCLYSLGAGGYRDQLQRVADGDYFDLIIDESNAADHFGGMYFPLEIP